MADVPGELVDVGFAYFDLPDRRRPGDLVDMQPFSFSLPDRRRPAELATGGTGGGAVIYYKLRARDSGLGPPPVYRVWVATDPTGSPPPPAPVGGWVDKTIVATWST